MSKPVLGIIGGGQLCSMLTVAAKKENIKIIVFSDDKPGLKNLITIYSSYSGISPKDIEKQYAGKMYSDFKNDLAEIIIESHTNLLLD